jgi:hypothetical protein
MNLALSQESLVVWSHVFVCSFCTFFLVWWRSSSLKSNKIYNHTQKKKADMKKQTHYKLTVTADYFSVSNRGSASSRLWSSYDDVNRFKLANTSSIVVLYKIYNYMNYSFMDWVLCYLAFYHCGKISNINNLQGDRLISARGFRGVGTRSLGSVVPGPWWGSVTVGACCRAETWPHGSQEEAGAKCPLKACPSDLLPLP